MAMQTIEELFERGGDVPEPVFVRDFLRKLERELELVRHTIGPVAQRLRRGDRVERRIDFDRVEGTRIDAQEFDRPGALRIEGPDPGVVIPALTADANARCGLFRVSWQRCLTTRN